MTMQLRSMRKNSKLWAQERGLLRTNEVHKADEWRIPVSCDFALGTLSGTKSSTEGTADLEVACH